MKHADFLIRYARKEFAPMGANSFLYEMTLIYMGGNNENGRAASPESVPIHFNGSYDEQ